MTVNFDLRTLSPKALDLLMNTTKSGWLFDELAEERRRRQENEPTPKCLILPALEPARLREAYLECALSLLALQARQLDLAFKDPVAAAELGQVSLLFIAILDGLKDLAQALLAPVN
jgi:hypothetical protein